MLSFWEKNTFLQYDYIVVGAGITGLSTAISLKEAEPDKSVLVLERGIFPTGASTKNAGFACFGSLTELISDLKVLGADRMLALVERRWKGLELLRTRLGDNALDYQANGGYELLTTAQCGALDQLDNINEMLRPLFNSSIFSIKNEKIAQFGFGKNHVEQLIFNPLEGQIDTGKMMQALWLKASALGVMLLTNCTVEAIVENKVEVMASDHKHRLQFEAGQIAICTNAFTGKFFPKEDIRPGRGIVLVTGPVADLPFKGVYHFDEGYYYFRNWQDRVIFGGGRNLDFEGETTTSFDINQRILEDLKQKLAELILPSKQFSIAHTWSGIMAFGANKEPIMKRVNEHQVIGVRLGGMGVAIGSLLGAELAGMMRG